MEMHQIQLVCSLCDKMTSRSQPTHINAEVIATFGNISTQF